jgi:hypothetical protein
MLRASLSHLVDPYTQAPLELEAETVRGDEVLEGRLRAGQGV